MYVVIGAGVSGLATALELARRGFKVTLFEKTDKIGGMAASFNYNGMTLDYGPHKIYTQLNEALDFIKQVVDKDLLQHPKTSKIQLKDKYFDYPVKITQVISGIGVIETAKLGKSYLTSMLRQEDTQGTYESYVTKRFGRRAYELIFRDYAQKVWGNPAELDAELARVRISAASLIQVLKKAILKDGEEINAKTFYYPRKGIQQIADNMAKEFTNLGGSIILGITLKKIVLANSKVTSIEYENKFMEVEGIVSTIPLDNLIPLFSPTAPEEVINSIAKLQYRALILIYLIVKKPRLFQESFIFYPEKKFVFNRLSEQKAFSEECVEADITVLCAEISCGSADEIFTASDEKVFEYVLPSLEKTGFLKKDDIKAFFTKRAKKVYPVYSKGFKTHLNNVLEYLDNIDNLLTIGRQGLFNYNNIDHCIDMALSAARQISGKKDKKAWRIERQRFYKYVIID